MADHVIQPGPTDVHGVQSAKVVTMTGHVNGTPQYVSTLLSSHDHCVCVADLSSIDKQPLEDYGASWIRSQNANRMDDQFRIAAREQQMVEEQNRIIRAGLHDLRRSVADLADDIADLSLMCKKDGRATVGIADLFFNTQRSPVNDAKPPLALSDNARAVSGIDLHGIVLKLIEFVLGSDGRRFCRTDGRPLTNRILKTTHLQNIAKLQRHSQEVPCLCSTFHLIFDRVIETLRCNLRLKTCVRFRLSFLQMEHIG